MDRKILIAGDDAPCQRLAERAQTVGFAPVILVAPVDSDAILDTAITEGVSGIVPAATAVYQDVAQAAAALNRPAASPAWLAPERLESVFAALNQRGVGTVEHRVVEKTQDARIAARELGFPLWACSADLLGQQHSVQVDHEEDLSLAVGKVTKASISGRAALWRAVPGDRYRVLGFKRNRDFLPVEIFAEEPVSGPYIFPIGLSLPSGLGGYAYKTLIRAAEAAAAGLASGYGLFQIDAIVDGDTVLLLGIQVLPVISPVEAELLNLAYGLDLEAMYIRLLAGEDPVAGARREYCAAARWLTTPSGVLQEVQGIEEARAAGSSVQVRIAAQPGAVLRHMIDRKSRDAVGCVIAAAPLRAQALAQAAKAAQAIRFITKPTLE